MTDLIVREDNLPASLEDLSKFVLIGRDKLQAVRAEINAMKNLNLAKEVHEQKLREGQEIGKLVLLAEARLGELFKQIPKATSENNLNGRAGKQFPPAGKLVNNESEPEEEEPPPKPKLEVAAQMGFNKNQVAQFQTLANNPEIVNQTIAEAKDNGEIPTRAAAIGAVKISKFAPPRNLKILIPRLKLRRALEWLINLHEDAINKCGDYCQEFCPVRFKTVNGNCPALGYDRDYRLCMDLQVNYYLENAND